MTIFLRLLSFSFCKDTSLFVDRKNFVKISNHFQTIYAPAQNGMMAHLYVKSGMKSPFLTIKDEMGIVIYSQQINGDTNKKILIDTLTWRSGLYRLVLIDSGVLVSETLIFIFRQKQLMVVCSEIPHSLDDKAELDGTDMYASSCKTP